MTVSASSVYFCVQLSPGSLQQNSTAGKPQSVSAVPIATTALACARVELLLTLTKDHWRGAPTAGRSPSLQGSRTEGSPGLSLPPVRGPRIRPSTTSALHSLNCGRATSSLTRDERCSTFSSGERYILSLALAWLTYPTLAS